MTGLRYVARRMLIALIVLAGISFVSFTTTYLLPGDPVTGRYPQLSQEKRQEIRARMGLDRPFPVQYARYMESLLHGDLGWSYNTGRPVLEDLKVRLPASLELSFYALLLAIVIGISLGIIAAVNRDGLVDHLSRIISIATLSIPVFWVGLVGIYIFFFMLGWVPAPMGRLPVGVDPPPLRTGLLTIDAALVGRWDTLFAAWKALALPATVFGLSLVAPITRLTRAGVLEALQEDYVTFARAVGIPEREVVLRDAFRGSLVIILTIIGYTVAYLIAGDAIVESVFAWPGIGRYSVGAVATSDMAPINGVLLVVAVGVTLTNLLVDLGYAVIDPRIRHGVVSPTQ